MSQLGLFIITVCSAVFSYQLLAYPLIYLAIVRKNPLSFHCWLLQAWMTAFATASTWYLTKYFPKLDFWFPRAAALPVSLRCMTNNRVDPRVSKWEQFWWTSRFLLLSKKVCSSNWSHREHGRDSALYNFRLSLHRSDEQHWSWTGGICYSCVSGGEKLIVLIT